MHYQAKQPICLDCSARLTTLEHACFSCGNPCAADTHYCNLCCERGSIIHRLYAPFCYTEPLKTLIHQYKFSHGTDLAKYLSLLMYQFSPTSAQHTQCLIPVPLHPKRLRERGFHHTWIIAKHLSQLIQVPVSRQYCKKIKHTLSQSGLSRQQRELNLHTAFSYQRPPYQHITLIDDVTTTGQTLNHLAQNFQNLGVTTIDAWVLAKA